MVTPAAREDEHELESVHAGTEMDICVPTCLDIHESEKRFERPRPPVWIESKSHSCVSSVCGRLGEGGREDHIQAGILSVGGKGRERA